MPSWRRIVCFHQKSCGLGRRSHARNERREQKEFIHNGKHHFWQQWRTYGRWRYSNRKLYQGKRTRSQYIFCNQLLVREKRGCMGRRGIDLWNDHSWHNRAWLNPVLLQRVSLEWEHWNSWSCHGFFSLQSERRSNRTWNSLPRNLEFLIVSG